MLLESVQTSLVDGIMQKWYAFVKPLYVINGDRLRIESPGHGPQLVWDINEAMVLRGCREDGWPIEIEGDDLHSVGYDSVSRPDEVW